MSAKPGKDFHSAYVDGEMPEKFTAEYERLVAEYPESGEELSRVRKIHELLREDAGEVPLSDEFVERSFEKLQSRMKFSRTVRMAERPSAKSALRFAGVPTATAAAAAVAVAMLSPTGGDKPAAQSPLRLASLSGNEVRTLPSESVKVDGTITSGQFAALTASPRPDGESVLKASITPIASADVKIDGTISSEQLPEVFSAVASSAAADAPQRTIRASSLVSSPRGRQGFGSRRFRSGMTSVDVFRPDFQDRRQLRISVPEIHEIGGIDGMDGICAPDEFAGE